MIINQVFQIMRYTTGQNFAAHYYRMTGTRTDLNNNF